MQQEPNLLIKICSGSISQKSQKTRSIKSSLLSRNCNKVPPIRWRQRKLPLLIRTTNAFWHLALFFANFYVSKKNEKERFQCSWKLEFNELTWIPHFEVWNRMQPTLKLTDEPSEIPRHSQKVWKDKCFDREGISLALIIALINPEFWLEHDCFWSLALLALCKVLSATQPQQVCMTSIRIGAWPKIFRLRRNEAGKGEQRILLFQTHQSRVTFTRHLD